MLGKGLYFFFCGYVIFFGYGMGKGRWDLFIDFILDEWLYYDCLGDMGLCVIYKNELLCGW